MNLRIKKYKKGWIVEYKKYYFFRLLTKWVHVTHYAGMENTPFYYKTPEDAREGALSEIKDKINYNFYFG